MSAQYLKRLELAEVDEDNVKTMFMKRVAVVEVLDEEGDQFFPTPDPDPEPDPE